VAAQLGDLLINCFSFLYQILLKLLTLLIIQNQSKALHTYREECETFREAEVDVDGAVQSSPELQKRIRLSHEYIVLTNILYAN
jgi:hypothetical protein